MELVDTHCHIHSMDYGLDTSEVIRAAKQSNVNRLICVGTDLEDSIRAIDFVKELPNVWASIGIHPHEADKFLQAKNSVYKFSQLATRDKVISIGECGLDYYYNYSSKKSQAEVLNLQLGLAMESNLPVIFHVRNAFDDFWPIVDRYIGIKAVLHSFTDDKINLQKALDRNFYIGVNGIVTFTKNSDQIEVYKTIPLTNLVLETDSPYLTPVPFRGMICEPKHVRVIIDFLAKLRGETSEDIADQTTENAKTLFKL